MMNLRQYFNHQQEKSATATAATQSETLGDTNTTVSGSSTVASTTNGSNEQSGSSMSTLPDDLPVPPVGNVAVKLDMVAKGPAQPRDCNFPRRKFSNGNFIFQSRLVRYQRSKGLAGILRKE